MHPPIGHTASVLLSRRAVIALLVLALIGAGTAAWAITFSADFVHAVEAENTGMTMAPAFAEVLGLVLVPLVLAGIGGGIAGTGFARGIARRQAAGRGAPGLWPRMGLAILLTLAALAALLILALALLYGALALLAPSHPGLVLQTGWDAVRSAASAAAIVLSIGILVGAPTAIIASALAPVEGEPAYLGRQR